MIKRQARLRREYLYRKNKEIQERNAYEKKKKILDCLENNKPIPTELREDTDDRFKEKLLIDQAQQEPTTSIDDEYAKVGTYDPKVLLTTSRSPSSRLVLFAKELRLIIPNSQKINRGQLVAKDLIELANSNGFTDVITLSETNGQPTQMVISHLPFGPTASFTLMNVKLRHDQNLQTKVSEAFPHLIFENFNTKTGHRVMNILKYLFPTPKQKNKRVLAFVNDSDFISFRHYIYQQASHKEVELEEVGPRFELRCYEIKCGNLEQLQVADTEYAYRPYINTANKNNDL